MYSIHCFYAPETKFKDVKLSDDQAYRLILKLHKVGGIFLEMTYPDSCFNPDGSFKTFNRYGSGKGPADPFAVCGQDFVPGPARTSYQLEQDPPFELPEGTFCYVQSGYYFCLKGKTLYMVINEKLDPWYRHPMEPRAEGFKAKQARLAEEERLRKEEEARLAREKAEREEAERRARNLQKLAALPQDVFDEFVKKLADK